MKIVCQRAALTTAFQTVGAVIPTRTPKEILKNLKLEAHRTDSGQQEVVLVGTDSEVGIRYKLLESEVQSAGEVLLSASRVTAILREMQGDSVTIETTDGGTLVSGARAEYKLGSENPAEFPIVAEFPEQAGFTIGAAQLRQMIKRTIFATDTESSRYALGGVLVEMKGESLVMAATDTRRLAVVRGQCAALGKDTGDNALPIVPAKALSLVERSLTDETGSVSVVVRGNDVLFKGGAAMIYSRLVEGRFPRYQDVIPSKSSISVDLVTGSFYAAVRQSQIVTSEESRGVEFSFGAGVLTMISRAPDVGESKVDLPISYDGPSVAITFDPHFVADFLRVLEPEQPIRLEMTDAENAAVFRTEDGYTYIVMPLTRDR
jgi:DNA polymerase III subunit beta